MANNFTQVGNELQVNLAPNQDGGQLDPDIATLTDGRFFVAFDDNGAGNDKIVGQFVNADGTLSGGNIDLDFDAGSEEEPAVAARLGGAAIVVWEELTTNDVQYAIVSGAGAVGGQQTILDGAGVLDDADVATLADGRSLVVAQQLNVSHDIVFRFVDAAGNPTGLLDFIDNGAGDQIDPMIAVFGSNALVVYADNPGTGFNISARFYDGTSFAAKVTIADVADDGVFSPDVAALTDGRFIVVWEDGLTDDIQARLVSAAGVPLGTAFAVSTGGSFDFNARVAALPDGGFIVTWTSEGSGLEVGADSSAIVGRRFDSNGAPAGDLFLASTADPLTSQEDSAVAVNAAGQAFVAWEDSHAFAGEDNNPDGVRGRAFLVTTDIVSGTEGDDLITTYSLSEPVNGLGGDDVINGLAGDDIIHGGAGFDQIKGGLGNDQLFGEGGEDLLKGEDGDDLLVGGLGRDVQIGGTGSDTFDFNASNESRVGANHDLVKGFSHAQHDKIDLKTIDADTTAGGNQAFGFIGGAGFTGAAGELRLSAGLLLGDTNGNGIADFEIKVTGIGAGAASDFVL